MRINFKSYSNYNLKLSLPKILQKVQYYGFFNKGFVSLPKKIERFTVLRSPHVDKKSREQFEIKVFSKSLDLAVDLGDIYKKQNLKFLLNFIKNSASGISVTIRYLI